MGEVTKVFFTHKVSGTPDDNPMDKWYDYIRGTLEKHSIDVSLKKKKKKADRIGLEADEIYHGEIESIETANCLIADVTYPSLGVGYEISFAHNKGYKVLCLFHKSAERDIAELSPMIKGAAGYKFYVEQYENEDDLKRILEAHLV
jgi:nucleoside 2-deoxyribosyltransferase